MPLAELCKRSSRYQINWSRGVGNVTIIYFLIGILAVFYVCWYLFFRAKKSRKLPPSKASKITRYSPSKPISKDSKSLLKEVKKSPLLKTKPIQKKNLPPVSRTLKKTPQKSKVVRKKKKNFNFQPLSDKHKKNIAYSARILRGIRDRDIPTEELVLIVFGILRYDLDPYQFEELVLHCFEDMGWQIHRSPTYSNDGGIDGRVEKGDKLYLIQSKKYKDPIKASHVKDLARVIKEEKAVGGFFVHTGKTKKASKSVLRKNPNIKLVSGRLLARFVRGEIYLKDFSMNLWLKVR